MQPYSLKSFHGKKVGTEAPPARCGAVFGNLIALWDSNSDKHLYENKSHNASGGSITGKLSDRVCAKYTH